MHERAESGIAATGSIIASKIDTANLLSTTHFLARGASTVEPVVLTDAPIAFRLHFPKHFARKKR